MSDDHDKTPETSRDWRNPTAYDRLKRLDRPGFAWEFLRRQPRFRAREGGSNPVRRIMIADPAVAPWGLLFRRSPDHRRGRCALLVV